MASQASLKKNSTKPKPISGATNSKSKPKSISKSGFSVQIKDHGSDGLSFVSVDDLEPRIPPRMSLFPSPFDFPNKPVPSVPDVSLIFDSENTTLSQKHDCSPRSIKDKSDASDASKSSPILKSINSPNSSPISFEKNTPEKSEHAEDVIPYDITRNNSKVLEDLKTEVSNNSNVISNLSQKLDKVLAFQTDFLAKIFQKGALCNRETQTDFTEVEQETRVSKISKKAQITNKLVKTQETHPSCNSNEEVTIPNENHDDTLSGILQQLNLPTVHEPSVFSEVPALRSLELQEYNEDSFFVASSADSPVLGASASAYNSCSHISDSDEEENQLTLPKPTATFYNNVLGNVNRLLESSSNKSHKSTDSRHAYKNREISPKVISDRKKENLPVKYVGSDSGSSGAKRNRCESDKGNLPEEVDEVVVTTKKYLEKLGVNFGSCNGSKLDGSQARKYMIQQNVYNSIYIPTVNCAAPVSGTFDQENESSTFNTVAQKYAKSPCYINETETIPVGKSVGPSDATMYGLTTNNLSFATKEYLERYGLVTDEKIASLDKIPSNSDAKVLDMTAIRRQPKL